MGISNIMLLVNGQDIPMICIYSNVSWHCPVMCRTSLFCVMPLVITFSVIKGVH
jgi:hypothetical protein